MATIKKDISTISSKLYGILLNNDRDRVVEAKDALHRMLNECKDELRDVVLLVFANKQDLPDAMNTVEITDKLR
ncbi:hypothetical protein GOBAR_AA18343 [Gossypium barbadense]|uniref:Uncharacterized protein n=1 Tax=Gossypium barbadense TaxID=3634 RepID=A0A2P5XG51_GOSBA|nr:hypothetical protein GOBAR_AA18343 [Gossypium barbadense]